MLHGGPGDTKVSAMFHLNPCKRPLVLTLLGAAVVSLGCGDLRNVLLAAKRNGPVLEFVLSPQGGLSIGNVEVWDVEEREMLWKVFVSRQGWTTLRYGVVPSPQPQQPPPKQFVPEPGHPPRAFIPGNRLFVLISGHYRNSFNPGAATLLYAYLVTIGDDGSVVSVTPQPRVMYSDVKMLPSPKSPTASGPPGDRRQTLPDEQTKRGEGLAPDPA